MLRFDSRGEALRCQPKVDDDVDKVAPPVSTCRREKVLRAQARLGHGAGPACHGKKGEEGVGLVLQAERERDRD